MRRIGRRAASTHSEQPLGAKAMSACFRRPTWEPKDATPARILLAEQYCTQRLGNVSDLITKARQSGAIGRRRDKLSVVTTASAVIAGCTLLMSMSSPVRNSCWRDLERKREHARRHRLAPRQAAV